MTDLTTHQRIPLTNPIRTLVDLATEADRPELERAVNEADKLDLIDADELRDSLPHYSGEPGVRALRELLDRHRFLLSDSELEVRFRAIAESAGIPKPRSKRMLDGFEVDFLWGEFPLVVETDGLRYHRTPVAQARDRLRDQTLVASGFTVLRFTHFQVRYEPDHVRRILQRTARRLLSPSTDRAVLLPRDGKSEQTRPRGG